ncbi:PREDICTED: F-box/kelch-repeat protein At3g23880-like [Fragaria vesca subsp. vesca]|uniref:F-box/kelch-repeat protein At3g23880-like n=1 Tax=Fragaria vesca subsp. vesca TaxID=101020 RepID=UPI0002C375C5|nr:PREDICTED: F-box/kelch-repeat protein At3g23880-like [Fragaria vesca subsp. vesca]
MEEVLSRLPPKSLMRFKCVRKSWQRLISNSAFAAKHLSASKRNKHASSTTVVLRRCVADDIHSGKKEVLLSSFDLCQRLDGDDELHPILEDLYSPLSPGVVDWHRFCVRISTHCDGILCLTDSAKYIVLCDPTIKEFKCLPAPSLGSCADGFGYDLKSKDYKIVRVLNNGFQEFKDGMRRRVVAHPPTRGGST